jgi:heptosyltransferase I
MSDALAVCLLRLSALGDVSHVLPLLHAWRQQRPQDRLSWILGASEGALLAGLPGVELIIHRKSDGLKGVRATWQALAGRRFDALLLMQLAVRANLLSLGIRARRRIGYDRMRSKEGHSLFINERIAEHPRGHVLETLLRFGEPLGVKVNELVWDFATPPEAHDWAREQLPDGDPWLGISPCSSHALRNWRAERYAAVALHAQKAGLRVVLLGGRSAPERQMAEAIRAAAPNAGILDLTGKDTLKQLPALLARLTVLISPDAGPAHLASAVGTPVIGLYAATDARRSGPYRSLHWCVNHYAQVCQQRYGKPPEAIGWGRRIEYPGVMDVIQVEEVSTLLDRLLATPATERLAPAWLRAS